MALAVYAVLSIFLSWYLRARQPVLATIWHEFAHWGGLVLAVYLISIFVDIGLIKLSVLAFTLGIVSYSKEFVAWVQSVNSVWFVAIFIVAVVRPFYRAWIKK